MNIVNLILKTRKVFQFVLSMAVLAGGANSALAVDYPEPGDIAAGAQAWAETCTHCHNLRNPNELRDDQWITSMFHMRIKAGLTGKETRDILSFIQAANATAAQERIRADAQVDRAAQQKTVDGQK